MLLYSAIVATTLTTVYERWTRPCSKWRPIHVPELSGGGSSPWPTTRCLRRAQYESHAYAQPMVRRELVNTIRVGPRTKGSSVVGTRRVVEGVYRAIIVILGPQVRRGCVHGSGRNNFE